MHASKQLYYNDQIPYISNLLVFFCKQKATELLSWMLASVVVRFCDGVMPDADWAEQLLYSNYKTYKFTTVAQLALVSHQTKNPIPINEILF